MLSAEMKKLVANAYRAKCFAATGCMREGGFGDFGKVPQADMERISIYRGGEGFGTYDHAPALIKFRNQYILAWNSGEGNEDAPGQSVLIAKSSDGKIWSRPQVILQGNKAERQYYMLAGFYVYNDTLYMMVMEKFAAAPDSGFTMTANDTAKGRNYNNIWKSSNGETFQLVKRNFTDMLFVIQPPALTPAGRLLLSACNFSGRPVVLLWPGADPEATPEVIDLPWPVNERKFYEGHDLGIYCYGENCFYALDDGTLVMILRNENGSSQLGIAISNDGGKSWSTIMQSNFPDSASRLATGRLSDGRYFIVGNSTRFYMDRNFFAISLSNDGKKFTKMYQLIAEAAHQRFGGELKCHGYQYPAVLTDGSKLLIAYSVNKEDIECGILDIESLQM